MELIELRDIYKTYHLGEIDVPVLKGISLTRFPGASLSPSWAPRVRARPRS